jgi:hypothetical protein
MGHIEQLANGDIAQFTVGLRWEQRFGSLDFVQYLPTKSSALLRNFSGNFLRQNGFSSTIQAVNA